MATSRTSLSERVSALEHAVCAAAAEASTLAVGRAYRMPRFAHVFDANQVRDFVPREPPVLDEDLERAASLYRAIGSRHLELVLPVGAEPGPSCEALVARGFVHDRLLVMVAGDTPSPGAPPEIGIRRVGSDVPWHRLEDVIDRMNREEPWHSPELSAEIAGALATKSEVGALQMFVAERAGRTAGLVGLARSGPTATIVSLGTLPDFRGQGVGSALVGGMIESARADGSDLIYLVTRAADRAQELYRRLGFSTELELHSFLRLD